MMVNQKFVFVAVDVKCLFVVVCVIFSKVEFLRLFKFPSLFFRVTPNPSGQCYILKPV